jgi:hypothetical protein
MALQTIRKLMATYNADEYFNALPPAESMTWMEPSVGVEELPSLLLGNVGNRSLLTCLVSPRDTTGGSWEVRYCLRPIGDDRACSMLQQITCDEAITWPLVAPFKWFSDGTKAKKRMLSMLVRYYFLLQGHISRIDSWNDDFSRRLAAVLRKTYKDTHETGENFNGSQQTGEIVEESSEPEDAESMNGLHSTNRSRVANTPKKSARKPQSPPIDGPHSISYEENPDLHRLRSYLAEHDALHLLENIPDAEDMKFEDQTYILEAQPKKLFVGSHATSGDDIYAYMILLELRGFHEIRFYVESAYGSKTVMPAETTGKQRILHPFSKTYPRSTGPTEQADRARFTLMTKWYFIAAGIATDCVLNETKAYPERLRHALEYIAEQMGSAAVKASENVPTEDGLAEESSESSYAPEEKDIQSSLANEPKSKPRFPPSVARKSAPSIARRSISNVAVSQQSAPRTSFTKSATPEAAPTPKAPSRGAKRSAEDEEFDALSRLMMKQNALTKNLNDVDHELEVMDAQWEAFEEKWKRERAELEKKRDGIQEQRSVVRNMFKKRRMLNADGD